MNTTRSKIAIDQTIMPPDAEERDQIAQLLHLFTQDEDLPKLVGMNGESRTLPEDIYQLLCGILEALAEGFPVRVQLANRPTMISTSQAADILGVSRPTMVRFLEERRLRFTQPGKHRRLWLKDVLEFRERRTREQHEAVADLTDLTYELFDDESAEHE